MKYWRALAVLVIVFTARSAMAEERARLDYPNPLIEQRADPFVVRHTDGYYYFTASVPEYDRIELRRSRTIAGLADAPKTVIWKKHAKGEMGGFIWAPEIHFIDGKWYVYFAGGRAESKFNIRMYALVSDSPNPLVGKWTEAGQIKMKFESFTLDATTFAHRGKRYMSWAQNDPKWGSGTRLYLAEMSDPLTLKDEQVAISSPELEWERRGPHVNEGPAFIARNGRVFIAYSASRTDHNYCIGLLTADEDANLLDPASWTKTPKPVMTSSDATGQYGPGHNSFTVAEDGKTDLLVYHARNYKEIKGEPLYDPNRHARVKVLGWTPDGAPDFGVPPADDRPAKDLPPAGR